MSKTGGVGTMQPHFTPPTPGPFDEFRPFFTDAPYRMHPMYSSSAAESPGHDSPPTQLPVHVLRHLHHGHGLHGMGLLPHVIFSSGSTPPLSFAAGASPPIAPVAFSSGSLPAAFSSGSTPPVTFSGGASPGAFVHQGQRPFAGLVGTVGISDVPSSPEVFADDPQFDETDEFVKTMTRKARNRQAAARSRKRKQERLETLESAMKQQAMLIGVLKAELASAQEHIANLEAVERVQARSGEACSSQSPSTSGRSSLERTTSFHGAELEADLDPHLEGAT